MKIKILGGALLAALLFSKIQTSEFSGASQYQGRRCWKDSQCNYPAQQKCSQHHCVCDPSKCSALGFACTSGVNKCVDCVSDAQCIIDPSLTHCQTSTNKCVQCLDSTNCSDPNKPVCYENSCVQCSSNTDCTVAPLTTCDLSSNTCICNDSSCPTDVTHPQLNYCSTLTSNGVCSNCRPDKTDNCDLTFQICDNFQCTCDQQTCQNLKGAGHGKCVDANTCSTVQCLANGDCPNGSACDTTTNTCVCDSTSCTGTGGCVNGFCSDIGTCLTQGSSSACSTGYICVDNSGSLVCQPANIQCKAVDGSSVISCPTGTMCLSGIAFSQDPILQYADVCVPIVTSPIECLAFTCPDGYSNNGGATVTDGTNLFCSCSKPK